MATQQQQFGNSSFLYKLLLLRYLMEQAQAQQGQGKKEQEGEEGEGGKPGKTNAQKIDEYIRDFQKLRQAYGAIQKMYNGTNRGATPSTGSTGTPTTTGANFSSSSPSGFSSVEEMMGNGLYTPAPTQYQTPAGNTTPSSTTSTTAPSGEGFKWADAVPYVNTALSIYNAYKIYNNKNMDKDERNLRLAGQAAQASTPVTGAWGSAAAAGFNTGAALSGSGTEEEKTQAAAKEVGMAVANYWTAGLAGLADWYARKQWGGTMKKLDKFNWESPLGPGYALNLATRPFDTDAWKKEGGRVKKLIEAGVDVPEMFRGRMYQTRGLDKKQLVNSNLADDYVGMTNDYGWVNNKFQNSRNESDMTYYDLAPYAAWTEKRSDWWKLTDAQRRAVTDKAQEMGAVREHHGTLDVDWSKVGDVDQIIASVPPEQQQQMQQQVRIARPKPGQVARLSPGVYRNSSGKLQYNNQIPRAERKKR